MMCVVECVGCVGGNIVVCVWCVVVHVWYVMVCMWIVCKVE